MATSNVDPQPGLIVEHSTHPEWGRGRIDGVDGSHVSIKWERRAGSTVFDARFNLLRAAADTTTPMSFAKAAPGPSFKARAAKRAAGGATKPKA